MHARLLLSVLAVLITAVGVLTPMKSAEAACRNLPPDYPGCTLAQAAQREAPTKKLTHHRYKKARWGQSGNEWINLGPRANRVLKREYRQSVDRFHRAHAKANAGKRAWPIYRSWRQFKRASSDGCTGQFGTLPAGWCWFGKSVNEPIREATGRTIKTTLTCAGVVAITRWGDGLDDKLIAVAKSARRLGPWRPYSTAACVVAVMYTEGVKQLFRPFKAPRDWPV